MLCSDGFRSGGRGALPELVNPAARRSSGARDALYAFVDGLRERLVQPRFVVGLVLIAGGVVWAVARGLEFYGVTPADVGYDVDQPPLLLALVGICLVYRSRRR